MDSGVPMILPKGILVNTTSIYQEVASYPVVPAAKIWEYWHARERELGSTNAGKLTCAAVYTTTNKKLRDPTARRLENFWWQVWGSDRRFLSGRELARIYENISVGHSFVPLRGPPNRWEGPDKSVFKCIKTPTFTSYSEKVSKPARPRRPSSNSPDSKPQNCFECFTCFAATIFIDGDDRGDGDNTANEKPPSLA
ncbi:hypothetical protein E4U42_005921 [Claviceps africana]|uniref:Uncharacterized protein n=1 Tax=Claviceps africana TaxID=83212 RepID=A0A8K0J403_9HYPO|nr:hypothetical protein E4U42_005921 [Claviceps africana]